MKCDQADLHCSAALITGRCFFTTAAGLFFGIRMPILNWTDETAPIKQSGAVVIAIFGTWGVGIAFAGLYLLMGCASYLVLTSEASEARQ